MKNDPECVTREFHPAAPLVRAPHGAGTSSRTGGVLVPQWQTPSRCAEALIARDDDNTGADRTGRTNSMRQLSSNGTVNSQPMIVVPISYGERYEQLNPGRKMQLAMSVSA